MKRLLDWWKRKIQERKDAINFEAKVIVRCDESEISASYPNGETQTISWESVICIAIETNDTGPWGADLWWLIEGEKSRCAYPGGATGDIDALKRFPSLFPGFSNEIVIQANGCTSNARFVCWQRALRSNNSL
jgi:hypothetical protein